MMKRKLRKGMSWKSSEDDHDDNNHHTELNCLICFTAIMPSVSSANVLEDIVPSGALQIRLDNPVKNRQAFHAFCNHLNVEWLEDQNGPLSFDHERSLPLCFQCQNLYQELYQLEVQIKELERMLRMRVRLVKKKISESWKQNMPSLSENALLEGINRFRLKVVESEGANIQDPLGSCEAAASIAPKIEPTSSPRMESDYEDNVLFSDAEDETGIGNDFDLSEARSGAESDHNEDEDVDYNEVTPDEASSSDSDFEVDTRRRKSARISSNSSKNRNYRQERKRSKRKERAAGTAPVVQPSLTCHICDEVLLGRASFATHYREVHPEEKKYTCKYCQRLFKDLFEVTRHQRTHTGEKPFKCSYCETCFTTQKSMKSHVKNFHERETLKEIFACDKCDKSFITLTRLRQHQDFTHSELVVLCKTCGLQFRRIPCFEKHNEKQHDGKAERTSRISLTQAMKLSESLSLPLLPKPGTEIKNINNINNNINRVFTCHVCWKSYITQPDGVKLHFEKFHPGCDPNQCSKCGKRCNTYTDTRKHAMRHVSGMKQVECEYCQKKFFQNNELKAHIISTHLHQVKNPNSELRLRVLCKLCGYSGRRSYFGDHNKKVHDGKAECTKPMSEEEIEKIRVSLKLGNPSNKLVTTCHVCDSKIKLTVKNGIKFHFEQCHPGMDPNQCSKCGKRSNCWTDIRRHCMRHVSDNKTLQCDQCPLRFFSNNELKSHVATHIPEDARTKYACDICGTVCTTKLGFDKHLLIHQEDRKEWVCEICGRKYAYERGLTTHKKVNHLKLLAYPCNLCDKKFALNSSLVKHQRSHTKQRPYQCTLCHKSFPYASGRARHVRDVHCKDQMSKKRPGRIKPPQSHYQEAPVSVDCDSNGMEGVMENATIGPDQVGDNFSMLDSL